MENVRFHRRYGINEQRHNEIAHARGYSYRRGVDGSHCAFRALEYAAEQAANTGSILQIFTVYNEFPGLNPFGPDLDQEKARALVRAAIDKVHESHREVVTTGKHWQRSGRFRTVRRERGSIGARCRNPRTRADRRRCSRLGI
jgi:hypothetical protein